MRPKLLTTMQSYSHSLFLSDLAAGVTVAMGLIFAAFENRKARA